MRTFTLCLIFGLVTVGLSAQVKIGNNPETISASSLLELESDSRVLVITRMSNVAMLGTTPLRGALVYNNDEECVFYFDGSNWQNLCADSNTTNVSLELNGTELVLTDSEGNTVSVTIESAVNQTFSTDPIVNFRESIVITEDGNNYNFEVGEITGDNVVNGSLNGVDIQDDSITNRQLSANSVGQEELAENSVTDTEIDYSQVTLNDFTNDAGFITGAQQISNDAANDLELRDGIFYDDAPLQTLITDNTVAIAEHIAADNDVDQENELITNIELQGQDLIFTEGGNQTSVSLAGVSSTNTDDQTLAEVLTEGNNAQGSRIVNLGEPIDLDDAVTKDYVDNALASLPAGSDNQNLTGATLNSATNVLEITIEDGDPTTVDLSPLAGGTADGSETIINSGANITITGVGTAGDPYVINSTAGGGTADGNISNVQFTSPNLEFTGADGGFNGNVDLSSLLNTDNQNAAAVAFTPYLSLESIDSQAAIEELKDEVDAIVVSGGGNPNDELISSFAVNGGNLELVEAGTTFQVPLAEISTDDQLAGEVNILDTADNFTATNVEDALAEIITSGGGNPSDELNTGFQVNGLNLELTDAGGTIQVPLADISTDDQVAGEVNILDTADNFTATNVEDALAEIITSGGGNPTDELNTGFQVNGLNLELTDAGGTIQVPITDISTDDQNASEVNIIDSGNNFTATTVEEALTELVGAGGGNPNDELNITFEVNGPNLELTDSGGTIQVPLTDISTDDQIATEVTIEDVANNFTSPTVEGALAELASSGGGNPNDELNTTFEVNGPNLELTDAGGTIQVLLTDISTDDQTANEVNLIDSSNNFTSTTVEGALAELVGAGGGNPNDELNITFEVNGPNLELTDSGGTIQVPLTDISTDDQIAAEVTIDDTANNFTSPTVEGALAELASAGGGNPNDELNTSFLVNGSNLELTDAGGTIQVPLAAISTDDQIASEVNILDTANNFTATNVEDALAELASSGGGGGPVVGSDTDNIITASTLNGGAYLPPITSGQIQNGSIGGEDIASMGAADGQVLTWNNTGPGSWVPETIPNPQASNVSFTPTPNTTSTTVQSAIEELQTEIDGISGSTLTGTAGSIFFADTDGSPTDNNSQLRWDANNNRLAVGNISPQSKLDVDGQIQARNGFAASIGSAGQPSYGFSTEANMGMFRAGVSQLAFSTGGTEIMRLDADQEVGIGTVNPTAKLHVVGNSLFDGNVTVINGTVSTPPDYVFEKHFDGFSTLKPEYQMPTLEEVESYTKLNKHLPGIPSAQFIKDNGLVVNQALFNHLEKIEELFLHTIAQEKKIDALEAENKNLTDKVDSLSKEIEAIKALLLANQK